MLICINEDIKDEVDVDIGDRVNLICRKSVGYGVVRGRY